MPIKVIKNDSNDRRQGCPKKGRVLGLDLGSKTIGIAVSDETQSIATPITTIQRKKLSADLKALGEIAAEFEVKSYVIGWPVNMDGSEGPRCDATRSFAHEMKQALDLFGQDPWIGFWDERLSTQAVDGFVDERVDMPKMAKRGAKESGLTDKLAALHILQGYLHYMQK